MTIGNRPQNLNIARMDLCSSRTLEHFERVTHMSDGRPTAIHTRVDGDLRERFENWRRQQHVIPARSQAIRELIDKSLREVGKTKTKTS